MLAYYGANTFTQENGLCKQGRESNQGYKMEALRKKVEHR